MTKFEKIKEKEPYSILEYKGKFYALTESAEYNSWYQSGKSQYYTDISDGKCECYQAPCVDENDNEYICRWCLKENYDPETMDEDEACNWNTVAEVVPID